MNNKNLFSKLFSKNNDNEDPPLSHFLSKYNKTITDYENKMIINIINMSDILVKEIMVPRVDVIAIDKNSDIEEIINIIAKKGHSRLPIFENNNDNIVGILHSKDLLKYFIKRDDFDLFKIIREPVFVPESKTINDLLVEMREKKVHLAIVVDEYGGLSGIVCLEDIIEKIVGEIQDEFDNEKEDIIKIDQNCYLINSRVTLEHLNSELNINIVEDDIDTLGGLIMMLFGRIPIKGEKIDYKHFNFTIESVTERRVKIVNMKILNTEKKSNSSK